MYYAMHPNAIIDLSPVHTLKISNETKDNRKDGFHDISNHHQEVLLRRDTQISPCFVYVFMLLIIVFHKRLRFISHSSEL